MKSIKIFRQSLAFTFLLLSCVLSAQAIITEHGQQLTGNTIKVEHYFDAANYDTLAYDGEKSILKSKNFFCENNSDFLMKNTNDFTLEINLNFDSAEYSSEFLIIYDETGYLNYAFWEGSNPIVMDLPEGMYDIFAAFTHISGRMSYIIKEMINVAGGTSVEIDAAEANHFISVKIHDENGETLKPGVLNSEGNILSSMNLDRFFLFLPSNLGVYGYNYLLEEPSEGEGFAWDFYINEVSARYLISNSVFGTGFEGGSYFTKFALNGIDASISLENNPDNWVHHKERFQLSPIAEPQEAVVGFATQTMLMNEIDMGGWIVTNLPGDTFEGFLDNPIEDNLFNLLVFPTVVDHQELMAPGWEEPATLKGNAIVSSEGEILYGSGNTTLSYYYLGNNYYLTETGKSLLPFHPDFVFIGNNNTDIKQGNNSPIMVTAAFVVPGTSDFVSVLYKGMYGEVRETDFSAVQIEVRHNGEEFYSGNYLDFLMDFIFLPTDGLIEIAYTNTNLETEGIAGKNITKLVYNADLADEPPTLQMLQFRNSHDEVTHIFNSTEDGFLRIAGADFKYTITNEGREYYAYNEGNSIELQYSLYGQDEWTELELTEYPEHFQMPAFGDYYEASLAAVVVPEDNSWFDVRIICTDAAGNKQEQTISPAFKVENKTMGIKEADETNLAVYPNPFTNELNIQLPENVKGSYTFKISDITGKIIYSRQQTEKLFVFNGFSLPKGVYILSIESNGKIIAKKVVKK